MSTAAKNAVVRITALGASNTEGYGVAPDQSYPAQLLRLLQARGYRVDIINAGISGDTTTGMLARFDGAVPEGTRIVILQPGINDLHQLARREANIAAIQSRVASRGLKLIMLDNSIIRGLPSDEQAADGIHLTAKGYAHLAEIMLAQVLAALA